MIAIIIFHFSASMSFAVLFNYELQTTNVILSTIERIILLLKASLMTKVWQLLIAKNNDEVQK
jgi:hypothetical protein